MSQAFLKQLAPGQESLAMGGSNARQRRSPAQPGAKRGAFARGRRPGESLDASVQNLDRGDASGLFDRWHLLSPREPMVLGRDPRSAIVIDSERYPVVSREHAVVRAVPAVVDNRSEFPEADSIDKAGQRMHLSGADGGDLSEFAQSTQGLLGPSAVSPGSSEARGNLVEGGAEGQDDLMRWQLCDLGSANGTYVNGHRIWGCQILEVGDRVQLGQSGPIFCFEYQVSPEDRLHPAGSKGAVAGQPVTISQLFPLISTGADLTRKAYLIPGIVTVLAVVSLFLTVGQPRWFNGLLAGYLSFGAYYFVYRLCGKPKPWWLPMVTAGLTMLLLSTPLLTLALWFFRDLLPGAIPSAEEQLPVPLLFSRMLVGAGLMEELLKVLPLILLGCLARWLEHPWRDRLGIWEPLDGILLGAASAVGFTLLETLGQYVPSMMQMSLGSSADAAQLAGLQLLIPRLLGSVAGHIAYSGYFGYFIGLSVMVPQRRWLILGVGYGTASLLHALWNVVGSYSALLLAVVGVLSYACLVAAILKARSLSPHRSKNFATRFSDGAS